MLHGTPSNKCLHPQEKHSGGNERSLMLTTGELESTGDMPRRCQTPEPMIRMWVTRNTMTPMWMDVSEDIADESAVDNSRHNDSNVDVSGYIYNR